MPWGTDEAGYIGAAHRWAARELFHPSPLQLWPLVGHASVPLAYRVGPSGSDQSLYPLGFPVFLAPADWLSPELGPYLVAPLCAGILVLAAFALARRLAGAWAGVIAAALVASSPVTLTFASDVMSDVPSAAFLAVSMVMSLRPSRLSAAAAGAAAAAAVMIRPVTAPLLLIPAALTLPNVTRALLFAAVGAIGPLVLAWSQKVLFGGYLTPGYIGFDNFFSTENITRNLVLYPRFLAGVHSPFIFAGIAAVVVVKERRLAIALLALALVNYVSYLPYMTFDHISYLRFVLPAIMALMILLAALTVALTRRIGQRARWLAPLALAPAVMVAFDGTDFVPFALAQRDERYRVQLMGRYLREALPWNAVVITHLQGGAVAHYTGRPVIRFDLVERDRLEPIVDGLIRRRQRAYFLIDDKMESPEFKQRFLGTPLERLDWRPRALFSDPGATLWLLDAADRAGPPPGVRPPIDVVE